MQETLPGFTNQRTLFGEEVPPAEIETTSESLEVIRHALAQDALFALEFEQEQII